MAPEGGWQLVRTAEGEVLAVPPRPPGLGRVADVDDPLEAARRFAEKLRAARALRTDWPPGERLAVGEDAWERVLQATDALNPLATPRPDLGAGLPDPAAG